jgi:hypothetical protein
VIGEVFQLPVAPNFKGWSALLRVKRDPYGVWDALQRSAAAEGFQLAPKDLVCDARPGNAPTLVCAHSVGRALPGGGSETITARLGWGTEANLVVTLTASSNPPAGGDNRAGYTTHVLPPITDFPAPARKAPSSTVGEPFGSSNNCFDHGDDRFVVPAGTRLMGIAGPAVSEGDFTAVLAVRDAREALRDLGDQLEAKKHEPPAPTIRHKTVATGSQVWQLVHSVAAGGGCSAVSSPDGKFILVGAGSD